MSGAAVAREELELAVFPWQPLSSTSEESGPGPPWQQASEACEEEARRQFAQLLSRPEDLARLAEMQETVAAKLYRADLEVTAGLDAATDGLRAGLEALHAARMAVVDTRDNFASIDALCEEEGSGLANRHELIRDLAVMRVNLSRTIADAEAIVGLPEQAAAALELLSDERNLFACWEKLTALAQQAAPARAALETALRQSHDSVSRAASRPAATHFAAIDEAVERFEASLWRSVRRSLFAGRGGCRALVRALRVVEQQELLDVLLASKAREHSTKGGIIGAGEHVDPELGVVGVKGFKKRVLLEVREAVEERFTMTVDSLISEDEDDDEVNDVDAGRGQTGAAAGTPPPNIPVVLENLNVLMQQLTEAYDYAIPAFPPKYCIFEGVVAPAWHSHITAFLGKLVGVARELSNADIIAVLNWYQSYAEQMAALGVEVEAAPPEPLKTPEAVAMPPPSMLATQQTAKLPPSAKSGGKKGSAGVEGGEGGAGGDDPSVLSLESFLATGCEKKDPIIRERDDDGLRIDRGGGTAAATPGALDDPRREAEEEGEKGEEAMSYPDGMVTLVDTYTSRMALTVRTWAANLHRMTASHPLKPAEDGTLWTASDVEFFRLLNEQLEVAMGGGNQLVSAAAMVISSILLEFAAQQYKRLGGDAAASTSSSTASTYSLSALSSPGHFRRLSSVSAAATAVMEKMAPEKAAMAAARAVEYNVLLAGVNDASRCRRLTSEIESSLTGALGSAGAMEKLAKKMNGRDGSEGSGSSSVLRPALDAFTSNADHCAAAAAAAVVSDPSVVSLLGQLFVVEKVSGGGGGAWLNGEVSETLVATVVDYLGDVEQYVTRDLAPTVSEAVLSRVVKLTIEACMRQLQVIHPGTVDRMAADEDAIRECFADYLPHNRVDPWLQRLADVRDLAAADDPETFVLAYGLLVQSMPELGLEPAERLLAAREDIPRATQREILQGCNDLLAARLAAASTVKSKWSAATKALRFA